MYAVIETGGKQYRVAVGSEIEVEHLDVAPGQTVELDRVLLVADGDDTAIGRPLVDRAHVSASVVRQDRGDKVVVFKYRPKARRRVKHGHRQELTVLRVADIVHGERSAAKLAEAAKTERQRLLEAAAEEAAQRAAADKALAQKLASAQAQAATADETASGAAGPAASIAAAGTPAAGMGVGGEQGGKARTTGAKQVATTGEKATADEKRTGEKPAARPRIRAPRIQAPPPEGEAKPKPRGTRKDT
jgi:large subunit ribosomal protein L21